MLLLLSCLFSQLSLLNMSPSDAKITTRPHGFLDWAFHLQHHHHRGRRGHHLCWQLPETTPPTSSSDADVRADPAICSLWHLCSNHDDDLPKPWAVTPLAHTDCTTGSVRDKCCQQDSKMGLSNPSLRTCPTRKHSHQLVAHLPRPQPQPQPRPRPRPRPRQAMVRMAMEL